MTTPRNVSLEAQAMLPEIWRLLEQETELCHICGGESARVGEYCGTCSGQGRIPNPTFAQLLHVVRSQCNHEDRRWLFHPPNRAGVLSCAHCGECTKPFEYNIPSGCVTRNWTGQPYNSLRGAIEGGLEDVPDDFFDDVTEEEAWLLDDKDNDHKYAAALLAVLQARAKAKETQ